MKSNEILLRREQLINLTRSAGRLSTDDAAEIFGVSKETIRQDFIYLSNQEILKKVHGGAVICENDQVASLPIRESVNFAIKDKIARKALQYLPEGECTIGIDTGSTTALFSAYLGCRKNLMILTNSHRVLQNLAGTDNRVISLGGEFNREERAYFCDEIPQYIRDIKLDYYFLGTSGVKGRNGICTKGFQERFTKNLLLAQSNKKIVLADSSKFLTSSLVEVAPWSSLDLLITDADINPEVRARLESDIRVVIAE